MAGEKTVNDVTFRIRHTMMLVSDLDRSIDFYTRLLGMDVQRIRPNPEKNERVGYLVECDRGPADIIEAKGKEVAEAVAALRALTGPSSGS